MRRIGILGGTFNPPHKGHVAVASFVKAKLGLDLVLFLPAYVPPHKLGEDIVDPVHRLRMVELAIEGHDGFVVDETEIEASGNLMYSYDTIQVLREKYQDAELFFIIGADQVEKLSTWHRVDELVSEITFVGVSREGISFDTPYPVEILPMKEVSVSSSEIRERLLAGDSIQGLVPEKVYTYIKEHGLYGS